MITQRVCDQQTKEVLTCYHLESSPGGPERHFQGAGVWRIVPEFHSIVLRVFEDDISCCAAAAQQMR